MEESAKPEVMLPGTAGEIGGEFVNYLGLEFVELTGPHLHQPHGIVHGGAHCSVVETLASMGASVWLGDKGTVVGVNNNTDFYRAISEGGFTSTATPLHRGRSQQVWLVETVIDATGKLASRGQVRLQNLYPDV